jgi:glycosyltransferase involved in cell wall biosynthesis
VLNQLQFVYQLYRFSRYLIERKPDIVVASSPHPFIVFPASRIARKAQVPMVYEVRDLWPELLKQLGKLPSWHPYVVLNDLSERFAVSRAAMIMSVKPGDADYFAEKYNVDRSAVAHIPNGFLPGNISTVGPDDLDALRSRYKYIVGYVGAISRYYGLEELVKLAAEFKHRDEVGFVVYGGGDCELEIANLAKELDLKHFHMMGKIPRTQVEGALKQFDVCYAGLQDLDLHKYGISCNKIYEYMYAEKPILACYKAGFDPIEESDCGLTVNPGDQQQQAQALATMLADQSLRESMGRRARHYFDQHHDFSSISELLRQKLMELTKVSES